MENKLELKHLAPYLPYGLMLFEQSIWQREPDKFELISLSTQDKRGLVNPTTGSKLLKDVKPLLIPLSELTEEQWIEVLIAGGLESDLGEQWYQIVWEHGEDYDFEDIFSINISYHPLSETVTYDNKTMSFGGTLFINQLAAFNKLFELHADVYGLLEAGLALNKLEHGK